MIYWRAMTNHCVISEGGRMAARRRVQSPGSRVQSRPLTLALVPQGGGGIPAHARRHLSTVLRSLQSLWLKSSRIQAQFRAIWLPKPATTWMPQVLHPLSRSVVDLFRLIRRSNFELFRGISTYFEI